MVPDTLLVIEPGENEVAHWSLGFFCFWNAYVLPLCARGYCCSLYVHNNKARKLPLNHPTHRCCTAVLLYCPVFPAPRVPTGWRVCTKLSPIPSPSRSPSSLRSCPLSFLLCFSDFPAEMALVLHVIGDWEVRPRGAE
jgi:hypothetical protein